MDTLAKRLARARESKGLNQSELARALGLSPQAIQNWEGGKSNPRGSRLNDVASVLGITVQYLVTGDDAPAPARSVETNATLLAPISPWCSDTPVDGSEVVVPLLEEVELALGKGAVVAEYYSSTKGIRFSREILHRHHVLPNDAVCFKAIGNSMEPVLPDGSVIGVNKGSTNIIDGKIYALSHGDLLRVKILYRMPSGGLRMRSYNAEEHPDEEYTGAQIQEQSIKIIGRVFWYSVML
ncbi:hypothetical protein AXE65_12385 [Ventosimonas gracilis]|uniref:HTH cro/C1-type domain-containing protein n=1 Tax=Ventosimonas gracilis TaxID=1680762 RepID=A0A139SW86_9GAMM|nr:helix-turn-helix transcriptional regulator [Ventosimonas gracilis]KXU38700.1 hypothetical protein AXE65_12385 [Ventosimonas gracilis]